MPPCTSHCRITYSAAGANRHGVGGNAVDSGLNGALDASEADPLKSMAAARTAADEAAAQVQAARDAWQMDMVVGEIRRMDPTAAPSKERCVSMCDHAARHLFIIYHWAAHLIQLCVHVY